MTLLTHRPAALRRAHSARPRRFRRGDLRAQRAPARTRRWRAGRSGARHASRLLP